MRKYEKYLKFTRIGRSTTLYSIKFAKQRRAVLSGAPLRKAYEVYA